MPADVPVSELIRRCRAGEEPARAELFARYRQYLRVLADGQLGRHLRGKCDPSDLVQQTLLEAHRDFPTFQGQHEAELLAWLRRILAHNLFNEARRFATRGRDAAREVSLEGFQARLDHSSQVLARCLADDGPTPSEAAVERETAVRLADTLARLPENYQRVLLLRLFEGLSAEEVAGRMNTTAGAVRMLQMRALEALRELMRAETEPC
ncbi:MAG TPA: sigma-70 family RNA polymerase sigma factor [Gemmataceae bacterium]|nr:sigma-70 family RNA polymerase sigma factor [Gemmataceae bacterium]